MREQHLLYFYSPHQMTVVGRMRSADKTHAVYPPFSKSPGTWVVSTQPQGQLQCDRHYYRYLFWETKRITSIELDGSKGFIVRGSDALGFLQGVLGGIGVSEQEASDFIVNWYPHLAQNDYNLVYFLTDMTTRGIDDFDLSVKPESSLRLIMLFRPARPDEHPLPQFLGRFSRRGFTVVGLSGVELVGPDRKSIRQTKLDLAAPCEKVNEDNESREEHRKAHHRCHESHHRKLRCGPDWCS